MGAGNDNRQLCPLKVYIIVIIDVVIVWQALAVASSHDWNHEALTALSASSRQTAQG